MKKLNYIHFIFVLIIISGQSIYAQKQFQFGGGEGSLFLTDDTKIEGFISFHYKRDILQVTTTKRQYTFEASQVKSFVIMLNDVTRYFESLEVQLNNGYVRNQLFELLYRGEASLYTRIESVVNSRRTPANRALTGRGQGANLLPLNGMVQGGPPQQRLMDYQRSAGAFQVNFDFHLMNSSDRFPRDLAEMNFRRFKNAFGVHREDMSSFMKEKT